MSLSVPCPFCDRALLLTMAGRFKRHRVVAGAAARGLVPPWCVGSRLDPEAAARRLAAVVVPP